MKAPVIWILGCLGLAAATELGRAGFLRKLPSPQASSVNGKQPKFTVIPLIPGDSPEGRRRRRQRQRRQLEHSSSSSSSSSEANYPTTSIKQEEEQQEQLATESNTSINENPIHVTGDILYEGYGVHYADLWVGCPTPQRVTVIVDTGSSVTGFPCDGCHHCGGDADSNEDHIQYHTDALFRQEDSTCFEPVARAEDCMVGYWDDGQKSCRASKHYSEGSTWEAFEAVDQVYTGGDHNHVDMEREESESFRLHFACQDKVTGLFEQQLADGIMGMYNSPQSFWHQMYTEKKLQQRAFSLCFSEPGHVERTGTLAGAMVLGGTDTRLHKTPMVYAQETSPHHGGKYQVHLEKVYLQEPLTTESSDSDGDEKIIVIEGISTLHKVVIFEEDLNNKGPVIVDSGTTATYLTKQLEHRFVDVFNSMVPEDVMVLGSDKTYKLTLRQLQQLPTIVFQMTAWKSSDNNDSEAEKEQPAITTVPGMVGVDMGDPKHAGRSILVRMPPSHYLSREEDDDEVDWTDLDEISHYSFNVYFTAKSGKGGTLGANLMAGHDVLFNIENNRIGFAESDCEYAELVAYDEEAG